MSILGKLFRSGRKLTKLNKLKKAGSAGKKMFKDSPVLQVGTGAWLAYGGDQIFNEGKLTNAIFSRTPTVKPPAVSKPKQPAVAKPKPISGPGWRKDGGGSSSLGEHPKYQDPYYSVKAAEETIRQLGETAMYGQSSKQEQLKISQGGKVMKGSKRTAEIEVSAFRHALDVGGNYDKIYNPRKQTAVWMATSRAAEGGGLQKEGSGEWYTGDGGTPTWGYLTGETLGAQNIQSNYDPPKGMFTAKETDLWKYARKQYGFTGKGSTNAKIRHENYEKGTNIRGLQHSKRVKDMLDAGTIDNDWISAQAERRTPTTGNLRKAEEDKNKHFSGRYKAISDSIFKRQREYDMEKIRMLNKHRWTRLPWKK